VSYGRRRKILTKKKSDLIEMIGEEEERFAR
jgi:hypothetical protein